MNILNVMQCTNLGGMEQSSLRLMTGLQKRGHRCQVLSLNPIGGLGPLLMDNGIAVEGLRYRGRGGWRIAPELRRRLRDIKADAVIMTGHNLLAMILLGERCRGRRLLAMHFHHAGVKANWQWRIIYAVARRRFEHITYPSDFIRREAVAIDPKTEALGVTVRNPVALPPLPGDQDRRDARCRLGLPADARLVGNAGWLIGRKRFDVFLRVACRVAAQAPDVRFVIAGDGELRGRLMELADELGLGDRVFWLGWQEDMACFYRAIDVLLFNSDWDAFPTTPVEALSFGIPVVASTLNGGLGEVMSGAPLGCLYDNHDVKAMAEAVLGYVNVPAPRDREAARRHIASICNYERCVSEVERLLGS